jgi:hypothetical protein
MAISTLGRLLTVMEDSAGVLSLPDLARELDVTPERVESMLDYWIRKGKIRESAGMADCGRCSASQNCPAMFEIPRTYELVGAASPPLESEPPIRCVQC